MHTPQWAAIAESTLTYSTTLGNISALASQAMETTFWYEPYRMEKPLLNMKAIIIRPKLGTRLLSANDAEGGRMDGAVLAAARSRTADDKPECSGYRIV